MKYIILFVLFLALGFLGAGFIMQYSGYPKHEVVIGIGVLIIAFLLMPLFIIHRYKNKDLSSFKLDKDMFKIKDKD